MAGIRKVKARAGQIKEITNDEAQKLFKDKAIPEIKVDAIKFPSIPVNSEDRYKYINHRLGRKPDVQLIDESGEIRYVQVIHLSDDSLQLSWVGSIVGSIIIE